MSGRPTREAKLAIAYALRTGCVPSEAAKRYRVGVRTVQRGIAAAGSARQAGRPAKPPPPVENAG